MYQRRRTNQVKDNFSFSFWNHNNSLIYESKSLIWISSNQKGSTIAPIKKEFMEYAVHYGL